MKQLADSRMTVRYYIRDLFPPWAAQMLAPYTSHIPQNIPGQTKKTVISALNFIYWAASNAVGEEIPHPPFVCSFPSDLLCSESHID